MVARAGHRARVKAPVLFAWLVLIPCILWELVFVGIPLVLAFMQSLESGDLLAPVHPFVGLDNYQYVLSDPTFWTTVSNTIVFAFMWVVIGNATSLGLALLVGRIRRGVGFYRLIFYLPGMTTTVVVAALWKWLYDPDAGLINQLTSTLGLGRYNWLGDLHLALPSIIAMSVWWSVGYGMLIYLAGLQGVDAVLYEAAKVDGAGAWRLFWHVTLPQLRPMLVFQSVTGLIGGMQVFTQPYLLTQGGPIDATRSMVEYMYETAFPLGGGGDFSAASAMSFLLFAMVFVLVCAELWLVRGREKLQ